METPTATDIVMDSKILSFQPMSTNEPIVTEIIPMIVNMAYMLTRTFSVVSNITAKAIAMAIPMETRVPVERLFCKS